MKTFSISTKGVPKRCESYFKKRCENLFDEKKSDAILKGLSFRNILVYYGQDTT